MNEIVSVHKRICFNNPRFSHKSNNSNRLYDYRNYIKTRIALNKIKIANKQLYHMSINLQVPNGNTRNPRIIMLNLLTNLIGIIYL